MRPPRAKVMVPCLFPAVRRSWRSPPARTMGPPSFRRPAAYRPRSGLPAVRRPEARGAECPAPDARIPAIRVNCRSARSWRSACRKGRAIRPRSATPIAPAPLPPPRRRAISPMWYRCAVRRRRERPVLWPNAPWRPRRRSVRSAPVFPGQRAPLPATGFRCRGRLVLHAVKRHQRQQHGGDVRDGHDGAAPSAFAAIVSGTTATGSRSSQLEAP